MKCNQCGSHAINDNLHGRQKGIDLDLCDVCYWRFRAEQAQAKASELKEAIEVMCRKCRVGIKNCKKCIAVKYIGLTDLRDVLTPAERGE